MPSTARIASARVWIVVDVPNLAYRSLFTTGHLQYRGQSTGVAYGVFREIQLLQMRFASSHFVFCFDYGTSLRRREYPAYKRNRLVKSAGAEDEFLEKLQCMRTETDLLRKQWLPKIGFRNLLFQDGFEADDMIAVACSALPKKDCALVVSTDTDMYQLLNKRVSIWNPIKRRLYTDESFQRDFGLLPAQWVLVKAIAGCTADNVKGIPQIGEKRAIAYLKGVLEAKYVRLVVEGQAICERNLRLVRLPYDGATVPKLSEDVPELAGWRSVFRKLGIRSLGA